jgi:hypothetical protein
MIDQNDDRRLTQILEDLGPADPPAGFTRQVMERISLEKGQQIIGGRIVPFHKGGIAMTRKVMWGLAAAAAIVLSRLCDPRIPAGGARHGRDDWRRPEISGAADRRQDVVLA